MESGKGCRCVVCGNRVPAECLYCQSENGAAYSDCYRLMQAKREVIRLAEKLKARGVDFSRGTAMASGWRTLYWLSNVLRPPYDIRSREPGKRGQFVARVKP